MGRLSVSFTFSAVTEKTTRLSTIRFFSRRRYLFHDLVRSLDSLNSMLISTIQLSIPTFD